MKVVVGFDGSDGSDYIFNDIRSAGLPDDSEFVIVSATEMDPIPAESEATIQGILNPGANATWQREISPEERAHLERMLLKAHEMTEAKERELRAKAESAAEILRAAFPRGVVQHKVVEGHAFHAIAAEATSEKANLVVVGSQNANTLARLFLGSVSQRVVSESEVSVRVARAHAKAPTNDLRIIIGFDASANSNHAVEEVARRNWPAGTMVRVVSVAETKSLGYYVSHLLQREPAEESFAKGNPLPAPLVANLAETACARLRELGLKAEPLALEGDPKQKLTETAEEWNADCIFIGDRGHMAAGLKGLGAVARALATRADCSVEIVRHSM